MIELKNKLPSNRKFDLLFAVTFLAVSAIGLLKTGLSVVVLFIFSVALFFLTAAFKISEVLTPLNRAWYLLEEFLGRVVSPLVLGIIFFLLITPIGLIGRLLGRDELRLMRKPAYLSYWVLPIVSNLEPESFKNQF